MSGSINEDIDFLVADSRYARPEVAISACLAGERVRYDGRSKPLPPVTGLLTEHLTLLPICPEVAVGMTVPRPPIQLVTTAAGLKTLGRDDASLDMTAPLQHYSRQSVATLNGQLCGYILKSRSPSCGLDSTPVFNPQGQQTGLGSGLQAACFRQQLPWLPLIEDTGLRHQREGWRFILDCRLLYDWRQGCRRYGAEAVRRFYVNARRPLTERQLTRLEQFLQAIEQTHPAGD